MILGGLWVLLGAVVPQSLSPTSKLGAATPIRSTPHRTELRPDGGSHGNYSHKGFDLVEAILQESVNQVDIVRVTLGHH